MTLALGSAPRLNVPQRQLPPMATPLSTHQNGPDLFWLAERAYPGDADDVDVFVSVGDTVALFASQGTDTTAKIIGRSGILPVVEHLSGPWTGQTRTIDPQDIIARMTARPTHWAR